jgi:CRP-like cAMP-binding protein
MPVLPALEELIASHPFLEGLSPRFLPQLGECASLRRFGSHQHVFQEGGEADHFYLILTGKVILQTAMPGGGVLHLQTLTGGEALGWSWLFPPYQWSFTAITAAPTEVISFATPLLRRRVQEDAELANEFLQRLARTLIQRLHFAREGLVRLYSTRRSEG